VTTPSCSMLAAHPGHRAIQRPVDAGYAEQPVEERTRQRKGDWGDCAPHGTILGIGLYNDLWTRDTLNSPWKNVPDSGKVTG